MGFAVGFTPAARDDLRRLYGHLLQRAETVDDLLLAERVLAAIESAVLTQLGATAFILRKAQGRGLRRELLVPFGTTGYVVLAVGHQREEVYH